MSEAWNKMKKAKEDDYFEKQNREALLKLAQNKKVVNKPTPPEEKKKVNE